MMLIRVQRRSFPLLYDLLAYNKVGVENKKGGIDIDPAEFLKIMEWSVQNDIETRIKLKELEKKYGSN